MTIEQPTDESAASAALIARVRALEELLDEAIEFAKEGWAYADSYYKDKWDYDGQLAALEARMPYASWLAALNPEHDRHPRGASDGQ